jgi:hypothetical protein
VRYSIVRDDDEIDQQLNAAMESDGGSKFPGMTYEQGVAAGIDWLTGNTDDKPMED